MSYSKQFSKFGAELLPKSVQSPDTSVVVDGFPWWEDLGQETPLAAGALQGAAQARQVPVWGQEEDGVEDDAPGPFEAVFVLAFGEAFFDVSPGFFVRIARVGFFHR